MDAHAYLVSLGWAGSGHSLDSRPYKQKGHRGLAYDPAKVGNNGNGLVKPLLVSQRRGRLGVGKKAHEPQAGNQWWLKGFETALGNIGKSESERSSGTATPVVHDYAAGKHGGLYSFFVKGQQMQGTIGDLEETERSSRKRKSDVLDEGTGEVVVDATSKKQKTAAEFEQIGAYMALRDKDEKRRRRVKKPSPVEEFQYVGEYLEARSEKKNRKRKTEEQGAAVGAPAPAQESAEDVGSREERRERRRRRREEKQIQRQIKAAPAVVAEENEQRQSDSSETYGTKKAVRRAERKRRKAEKAAISAH